MTEQDKAYSPVGSGTSSLAKIPAAAEEEGSSQRVFTKQPRLSGMIPMVRGRDRERKHEDRVMRADVIAAADIKPLVSEKASIGWQEFKKHMLKEYNKGTTRDRVNDAKTFHYILTIPKGPGRIGDLFQLREHNRRQVMKSPTNLSKYMGIYTGWKDLKENHGLHWQTFSPETDAAYFEDMMYKEDVNYSDMVDWLKEARIKMPVEYAAILDYCSLTGLRACEAIQSIHKIQNGRMDFREYYNKEKGTLDACYRANPRAKC